MMYRTRLNAVFDGVDSAEFQLKQWLQFKFYKNWKSLYKTFYKSI